MKLESVKRELEEWGEIIVTTDAGVQYELHIGDTQFDMSGRMIKLNTPEAEYLIDGDAIENIKKHYGHVAKD